MSATMLLVLGGVFVFGAGTRALSIVGIATVERRGVARSLAAVQALDSAPDVLKQEMERPFAERVIAPLGERLVGVGLRITRADTAQRIQRRLDIAGNPAGWDVQRMIGLKALGMFVLGAVALVYVLGLDWGLLKMMLAVAGSAAFGYLLPNILLYNAGEKREKLMRNALPDAIDLLTVSVEAGLGFDAAVDRVARNTDGPLAQEFHRLLQEMQIGVGRTDAMRAVAERTTLDDLKSFCLAMVQADSLGVPIGRVLRIQSGEMRTKRRQRAEEKAQQVPVKIMVPLVLFILPCLFIVIMGPAGISLFETFSKQ